jgi:putative Mn2+ efflux pump MntP
VDLFSIVFTAVLFGLASNLDTWILALSWGVRGVRLKAGGWLILSGVTTAVTWLALLLGAAAQGLFAPAARMLGGLVLIAMGLWTVLDWLRHLNQEEAVPQTDPSSPLACVPLAAALAVNNSGIGVAAGVAGLPPWAATLANLAITLFSLWAGLTMGRRAAGTWLGKYGVPLSGLLLALLGGIELFYS